MTGRLFFLIGTGATLLFSACGKVDEVRNELNIPGHWLMTESEHASEISKAIQNESMVLTFKDGQAAFSPTDTVQGRAVFALLSECTAGPRPYRAENNDVVFGAIAGCEEKRVTIQRLDSERLKFPDPEKADITRTFVRIDEDTYKKLVKESDRKP